MWCKSIVGKKPGGGVSGVTSSICRKCWPLHCPGEPYPEDEYSLAQLKRDKKSARAFRKYLRDYKSLLNNKWRVKEK
jgi:hypothetical protein